jgi:Arylsulfotransferase (ASST)
VPDRTRRELLAGAGGAAALIIGGCGGAQVLSRRKPLPVIASLAVKPAGSSAAFHSRPELHPPTVATVAAVGHEASAGGDPGFLFLGPGPVTLTGAQQYGPLIVDRSGAPVWFRPLAAGLQATNFARSEYGGKPVLVWWEGKVQKSGYGQGEAVLLDRDYRELARVRAANGRSMDLHALTLTTQGTALFTCYPQTVEMDLSSIGAPRNSQVLESIIQEVEIASGRLLFEWRSLDHIPVSASLEPHAEPYDYLHVNSIQQLADGTLLISARHTCALYKLDPRTGEIVWTLGGKHSQLQIGPGAQFSWQHDARQHPDGAVSVFDNGSNGSLKAEAQSRGLVLDVEESRRRVTVRGAYTSPEHLSAGAMGSVQMISPDRVLVGWGVQSHAIEFAADGTVLFDLALPAGMYSYRSLWFGWQGVPAHPPAVAARRDRGGGATLVYASWNGATEVGSWQVAAGARHDEVRPLGIAPSRGFETVIPLHAKHRYASVTALDRSGRRLRGSSIIKL